MHPQYNSCKLCRGLTRMSLEPSYNKVVSNYKRNVGEMQSQIESRLPVDSEFVPNKILCANVQANVVSHNVVANVVNFDGVAKVQAIYQTIDGAIKSVDYTVEFKDKYVASADINAGEIIITSDVIDIRSSIESGTIRVVAVLNFGIDGIFSDSVNALTSATGDGVFTKLEDITYSSFLGLASEKFDASGDVDIKDEVDQILGVCANAYIDRVESNDNFVKVFGNVAVNVSYLTRGDNPTVRTIDSTFDVNQEVALNGVEPRSIVNSLLDVNYQNISVTTSLDNDRAVVSVIVPLEYKGYVWNEVREQVVSDIYSTTNYINVATESFSVQSNHEPKTAVERVSGNVTLEDTDLFIDEILGYCCGDVVVANTRVERDTVIVDGVASVTTLYRNNETNSIVSYDVQIPFSVDVKADQTNAECGANVVANLTKLQVKARRGVEIEVNGELNLYITSSCMSSEAVTTQVTLGEKRDNTNCNLVIYITKAGDTIWDIAKEMLTDEETILRQNPDLELPFATGTRVVVYRQCYVNY